MSAEGARILVVDDERPIRKLLRVALEGHGYHVSEAANGKEGLRRASSFHPDLMILDMGLPDMGGKEVLKQVREWSDIPVIILSVLDREEDKIVALDKGADDYVTKPFSMGELLARIRVALRHAVQPEEEPVVRVGEMEVDIPQRLVMVDGVKVKLTPTEYDILKNLALNAGRVLTHKHLLSHIWGKAYEKETHYLRVYVASLRRKIEKDPSQPQYIITEPGVGYRLVGPAAQT